MGVLASDGMRTRQRERADAPRRRRVITATGVVDIALIAALLLVGVSAASAIRTQPKGLRPKSIRIVHSPTASLGVAGGPNDNRSSPDDVVPDFSIHEPANLASDTSLSVPGGYFQIDAASASSIEAATYAILKLNCARKHAEPPCAPLKTAKVLESFYHVTATDFWFMNVTVGDGRLLHATVAVDNITIAEDLDCPALSQGAYAPFSLVRLTEYTGLHNPTQVDVVGVCKFERTVDQSTLPLSDNDDDDVPADLGMSALEVTGVHWKRSPPGSGSGGGGGGGGGESAFATHYDRLEAENEASLLGQTGPAYECDLESTPAWTPPASYDLRDDWSQCVADTPGNQGQCGSCWAFAAAYMFSYRLCVQSNAKYNERISAQHLVACDWGGTCGGGWDAGAMKGMHNHFDTETAMPSWADFPYTDGSPSRSTGSGATCESRDVQEMRSGSIRTYAPNMTTYATSNYRNGAYNHKNCKGRSTSVDDEQHERWIMYQIKHGGPVTAVMTAGSFPGSTPATDVHFCGGCGSIDHAVILVGWGVTDGGQKYWIMQNSWSTGWKDGGRVKIARGDNECCIEQRAMKVDPHWGLLYDPDAVSTPTCSNGGYIDQATDLCACPPPWTGGGVAGNQSGCEVCSITGCANGGEFDADACSCACGEGYGGPVCETTISASVGGGMLTATLRLGPMAKVNSDVTVAARVGATGEWRVVSSRGELCGATSASGAPSACPAIDESRSLTVEIDLLSKGIDAYGEDIHVKFVQNLGLNEFGNPRGYDMDYFGANLVANGGRYNRPSCAPVTVSITIPAAVQTANLRWSVGRGEGVSASLDVASQGEAVTKNMTACLTRGVEHNLRVNGQISRGSAFDRFSAVVYMDEYNHTSALKVGSEFAFPAGFLYESPRLTGPVRQLEGEAAFKVWDAVPPVGCGALVAVRVGASRFGNGAAASMMRWEMREEGSGGASPVASAPSGSFAVGATRTDVECVPAGRYNFFAAVSGNAAGAGGWGFDTHWRVDALGVEGRLAGKEKSEYEWFTRGVHAMSPTFEITANETAKRPGVGGLLFTDVFDEIPASQLPPGGPTTEENDYDYEAAAATATAAATAAAELGSVRPQEDAVAGAGAPDALGSAGGAPKRRELISSSAVASEATAAVPSSVSSSMGGGVRGALSALAAAVMFASVAAVVGISSSSSSHARGYGSAAGASSTPLLVSTASGGDSYRSGSCETNHLVAEPRGGGGGATAFTQRGRKTAALRTAAAAAVTAAAALMALSAAPFPVPGPGSSSSSFLGQISAAPAVSPAVAPATAPAVSPTAGPAAAPAPADNSSSPNLIVINGSSYGTGINTDDYYDDFEGDYDGEDDYGDYTDIDGETDGFLASVSEGAGCGAGVSPCRALHPPDCVGRSYLYALGVVGSMYPSGRVLPPLGSVPVHPGADVPHSVIETVGCPAAVLSNDTVCVRSHNTSTPDISPETCRAQCDATAGCVAFTHYTASPDARRGGLTHGCTLPAGINGNGPIWRASAGSESDDDASVGRAGVAGYTTYFVAPAGTDYDEFGLQSCTRVYTGAGKNYAPERPGDCVNVTNDDDDGSGRLAVWGVTLLAPISVDAITVYEPGRSLGTAVVVGTPLMYKECATVTGSTGGYGGVTYQTITTNCRGVVASEIYLVLRSAGTFTACGFQAVPSIHTTQHLFAVNLRLK